MRNAAVAAVVLVGLVSGCSGEEPAPRVYTIRYEVDACRSCGSDTIPEIIYTPYWDPSWGPRSEAGIFLEDVPVPWSYTFRSDHLRDLTVTIIGPAIGVDCRVYVDGELVDDRTFDVDLEGAPGGFPPQGCAARPPRA